MLDPALCIGSERLSYRTNHRTRRIFPLTGRIHIAHTDEEGLSCPGMFVNGRCDICGARGFVRVGRP
jgi:hypothetical protein